MRWSPALLLFALACKGQDQDGDGWPSSLDCDETDPSVHPDAEELCDGLDQDCDGEIDEAKDLADPESLYPDADGDGYGAADVVIGCADTPGTTQTPGDCDDSVFTVYPGGEEVCDGLDNDCDSATDEDALDASIWYADLDQDGYGGTLSTLACEPPAGYLPEDGDCNDGNSAVYPGGEEVCDGQDNDCNGDTDGADALDAETYYQDQDGDGYGDSALPLQACGESVGVAALSGDCDDAQPLASPGLPETCSDGIDNDCDGGANDCERSGLYSAEDAEATFTGTERSDYAGRGLAFLGDTDGDGFGEIGVGAYGSNVAGTDSGVLYLVYGSAVAPSGDNPLSGFPMWMGESPSDGLGRTVFGPGDVDGDGYAELLIGAKGDDDGGSSAGAAWLIYGGPTRLGGQKSITSGDTKFTGASTKLEAGAGLGGGDFNGDGFADLAIGAPADTASLNGYVYLIYGGSTRSTGTRSLSAADATLQGENTGDAVGDDWTLAGVGDLDGDGKDELAVGAPHFDATLGRSEAGALYLLYGGAKLSGTVSLADADARFNGLSANDALGVTVAGAGDTDGDGYGELLLGAYQKGYDNGEAYLLYGSSVPLSLRGEASAAADASFVGEDPYDYAGGALAFTDLDADGLADLFIGAENNGRSASAGGAVYLFYGGAFSGAYALGTDDDAAWYGSSTYDKVGSTLSGGGDVNGDGYQDLLFSAYWYDASAVDNSGAAFLLLGSGL